MGLLLSKPSLYVYQRPPRLEKSSKHIEVVFHGVTIVDTRNALRILETSHPPVYYIPPQDVRMEYLIPDTHTTYCEWKGVASYYTLAVPGLRTEDAAWCYPRPNKAYAEMAGYIAFYPSLMDACMVDGERVQPQPGDFYGGWVTHDIVGPFKGASGTWGW